MENLPEFISNHLFLATLFVAILILLLWNLFGGSMGGIAQISPQELTRLMNHDHGIVVDVRKAEDFEKGHILNALNIPEADFESREKELEKLKGKTVITCCLSGMSAPKIAQSLKTKGVENISSLKGGIQAWQSANLPLTRDKS